MFYIILAILIIVISTMLVVVLNNILMYKKDKYKYIKYLIPTICICFSIQYLIDYIKWPRDVVGTSAVDFSNIVFLSSYIIATIACVTLCILIDKEIIFQKKVIKPRKEAEKAIDYFVEEQELALAEENKIEGILEEPTKEKTTKQNAKKKSTSTSKEKVKTKKRALPKNKTKAVKETTQKKQPKTTKKK